MKALWFRLMKCLGTLNTLTTNRCSKSGAFWTLDKPHHSLSIASKIIKLWTSSFFWKWGKFYGDLKIALKIEDNIFGLEDNCVWTCWGNFSQIWQERIW